MSLELEPIFTTVVDGPQGEHWFIADGIGSRAWGTFRRQPSGALRRVTSPSLPMRPTRLEAEVDLAVYLCQHLGDPRFVVKIIKALRAELQARSAASVG